MNNETIMQNAQARGLSVAQYLHEHYRAARGRIAEASRRIELEERRRAAEAARCINPPIPVEALPAPAPEPTTKMGRLAKEICERHGVTAAELRGPRRYRKLTDARQEFCLRAVDELGFTMPQVGKYLNKDHTTVLHAVHKLRTSHAQV